MNGPKPTEKHPMKGFDQVCYIKNTVTNPNIIVGDYTYYDDPSDSEGFERNVLYHYPFYGDKLIIGKFCAIAKDVKFIMNGANHLMNCFSTYPFQIFGNGWEKVMPKIEDLPNKGDTVIGNDVWIGYDSLVMPGVKIGDGAIIASRSVVVGNVEPYSIVGGNPAKLIRKRYNDEVVDILLKLKWWDWEVDKITANLEVLVSQDLEKLKSLL
ncbi:MAG: Vat family streptogramin A O-acetyltransferase [Caldisericia bacterium]|nr:Vat family streptogramin A O-acetyltransferase [Caldisericia bacterium]